MAGNNVCGCQTTGQAATFCNDGKVCKATTSTGTDFACRDCTTADCPAHAPLCDANVCKCGSNAVTAIDTQIQNTCTTTDSSGVFSCGKPGTGAGTSCSPTSLNPRCFNDLIDTSHGMIILGDATSTCKVIVQSF